jgi:succinate dehydrogenase / fumarate reductase cytochrome b subunit
VSRQPYVGRPNLNLLRYRPGPGTFAWAFHRISGLGIFAFVVLHVIDIYLIGDNAELYNELLAFYASIPGRLLEVLLGAALLYHALNGLRIIIIDFWPRMTVYHRVLWWGSWVIFLALGIPGAIIILRPLWAAWLGG